jgi:hypothetical protein
MFRREALRELRLESQGFEFCSEITAKFLLAGHVITEVPISFTPRRVNEGKKLKWQDGFKAILTLFRFRFLPSR